MVHPSKIIASFTGNVFCATLGFLVFSQKNVKIVPLLSMWLQNLYPVNGGNIWIKCQNNIYIIK